MANSLLDFVMSLVRDPDVAARYAADPAGTIADADLTDVTSADVSNLIPVVSESLSMSGPVSGLEPPGAEPAANVWASGAATAAFDAFGDPAPAIDDLGLDTAQVITDLSDAAEPDPSFVATAAPLLDAAPEQFDTGFDSAFDSAFGGPANDGVGADWGQPVGDDPQPTADGQGFDLFD